MALTQASEGGLKISNAGTNGQYLQKQSGNAGGLTWATVDTSTLLPLAGGTLTGDVTFNGDNYNLMWDKSEDRLEFWDNAKLTFGDPGGTPDFQLYHDGSNSYIVDSGTGGLRLCSSEFNVKNAANNEIQIRATENAQVELYYDNVKKFDTKSDGVEIHGDALWGDNGKVKVGNSSDLQLYHDGTNSVIKNSTGSLYINATSSEVGVKIVPDGAVELFYDNIKRFETTSTGIRVAGAEGNNVEVFMDADEGDDDNDKWKFVSFNGEGALRFYNYTGGAWEQNLGMLGNGGVELYYDGSKKFETFTAGFRLCNNSALTMNSDTSSIYFGADDDMRVYHNGSDALISNSTGAYDISTAGTRRVYIASGGHITFQKNAIDIGTVGQTFTNSGELWLTRNNGIPFSINRLDTDGQLIRFHQAGTYEGDISVSGSTVSYNGGHLSRWSQFKGLSKTDKSARPTIYQGTVLSNLDDLCEWEGEINQQLNMTQVSTAVGDKNVAGVFWTWDNDDDEVVNDFYVAMTGDMVIRVAGSTTVARGDLLISAGDGTAKPQADDIIRSSTIAKIISTNSTATYADGSKAYPCVLMAC